ncbi:MAG: sigma-70 family RNA polymerase sigma factor [Deltaproteobacteria bacterium]|nr:sigma-70 family RNA polymerase sigma factor [Deltaproteobacteria bacterium]
MALTIECRMRGFDLCQADQDDLVQEVLIQMWRVDLSRFNQEKPNLATYAKRRLRWMLIDFMRARSKISTPQYVSNIDELADLYLPAVDPEQVLEDVEMEKM